jgi:nicotinate dehydrogenase subunit A
VAGAGDGTHILDGATVVRLSANGTAHELRVDPEMPLLDLLRAVLQLKGTRRGCGQGECGACHVLLDGRSVAACQLLARDVAGRAVTTVEGLDPRLHKAFVDEQAAQCGYCSSGLQIAAAALIASHPQPSEDEVRAALDPHLCRCGAHPRIVRAVQRAAAAIAR